MQATRENTPEVLAARAESKATWVSPVMTELKLEDAESGVNVSENGATGS